MQKRSKNQASFEQEFSDLLRTERHADACRLLLEQYGPEVHGYFRGVLANEADGDDLYQDLAAALWKGLSRFRQSSSVRTWIYAIAHHLISHRLRRYSRKHVVRLDTGHELAIENRSTGSAREHAAREHAVAQMMDTLKPEEREIVILRIERNLAFPEIGTILGCSELTARQRFQRVKARLKLFAQNTELTR